MSMRRLLYFAAAALIPFAVGAAELTVAVTGLQSEKGRLRVALFRTPEDFPKEEGRFREAVVAPRPEGSLVVFSDLPPGTYGLAAFHDENDNGDFDRGLFGIPLEGYGFGNDATVVFSPPDFAEAAVTVGPEGVRTTFRIRYWLASEG